VTGYSRKAGTIVEEAPVLPESLVLVNTFVLVSSKRRVQTKYESVVKIIVKFIRKTI
jgi:hypothetical protein